MEKPIVFTRKASGLVRELAVTDVAIFLMAVVFGAGILMFAPQGAVAFPGSSIPLAYLLVGILMLPFIITIGYMLTALPRTGGLYTMVSRTLHPTIGYMGGWMMYVAFGLIAGLVSYVTVIVGEAGFARIGITVPPLVILAFALVMVFVFGGINMAGVRAVRNVTRVIVLLPLVVLIGVVIYMLVLGYEGGVATFDTIYGAGAMERIIDAAGKAGWTFPSFSWMATITAFLAVIFAYGGAETVACIGGEMRATMRTIFWGLVGGFVAIIIIYLGTSHSCFAAFGSGVAAYTFLANNDPEALAAIVPAISPSVPYFMLGVIKSNWLAFVIAMVIMLWPLNGGLILFTGASRFLFAFSFDRAIPERFSEVNRRGAPTWAVYLTVLFGIAGVLLFYYGVGAALGILTVLLYPLYWLFGLSAMLLPFVRPDIAERLPCGTKTIIGLGLYSFLLGWFFMGVAAKELDVIMILVLVAVLLIGFAFYLYQQQINKRKGLDISEVYRQIPPE